MKLLIELHYNLNLQTQRAAVENWILQRVDAIVVRPVDPTASFSCSTRLKPRASSGLRIPSR